MTLFDKQEIIERLAAVWKQNPDLRLGQLLVNVYDSDSLYQAEDYPLLKRIENFYGTK